MYDPDQIRDKYDEECRSPSYGSQQQRRLSRTDKNIWGSNQSKLLQARLYQHLALYEDVANAVKADSAAMEYRHYLLDVNPLSLVYLTNMNSAGASHSANTMFHNWFGHSTRCEWASGAMRDPPPGYLWGAQSRLFNG
jgi:hypothetical protein